MNRNIRNYKFQITIKFNEKIKEKIESCVTWITRVFENKKIYNPKIKWLTSSRWTPPILLQQIEFVHVLYETED